MNKKAKVKALALSRETVRALDTDNLSAARGEVCSTFTWTLFNTCHCPSVSCDTQCTGCG